MGESHALDIAWSLEVQEIDAEFRVNRSMSLPRCEIEESLMAGSATTFEENLALAQSAMARYADTPLPHDCGSAGAERSGETFTNHSPIDGRALGDVAAGDAADIDAAAQAAYGAFLDWRGAPAPSARRSCTPWPISSSNAVTNCRPECVDTGQTMRFMSAAALRGATTSVSSPTERQVLQRAVAPVGRSYPLRLAIRSARRDHRGIRHSCWPWKMPRRLPPLHGGAQAGRMVALHRACRRCALEAGLPPGVLNVVHGMGESAGASPSTR